MKVQVNSLSGARLDWAVAKCEDFQLMIDNRRVFKKADGYDKDSFYGWMQYNPSTNWTHGGYIIERERITLDARESDWQARIWDDSIVDFIDVGKRGTFCNTPLIAAMRCYVMAKLGNEIEIPDELA
jgi:hypothetical protein